MSVFLRLQVKRESIPDPGAYIIEFLDIYVRIDKNLLNADLRVFNLRFTSYQEAIQAFFIELRARSAIAGEEYDEPDCVLRALIHATNFNFPYIEAFASELSNQLITLSFCAGICAGSIRDTASMDKYVKEINDDVGIISSYTAKWLNDSLTSAWPSAHNGILKEQIMSINPKFEDDDENHLKLVANVTHPILTNTGLPNFVYEMVVVRAQEKKYELYYESMKNYCSLNKEAFGFDTVIARFPLNSTNPQEKFEMDRRMFRQNKHAEKLNITIQSQMNELYNAATLPLIAVTLKQKISKEFISEQDFHCWAIVRKWSSFFKKCPKIDYISSSYNFINLNSITNISYSNSGHLFQDCEEFRFFFFM